MRSDSRPAGQCDVGASARAGVDGVNRLWSMVGLSGVNRTGVAVLDVGANVTCGQCHGRGAARGAVGGVEFDVMCGRECR